jgi:hypothetical protein
MGGGYFQNAGAEAQIEMPFQNKIKELFYKRVALF